jgi:hypothetical protein
VRVGATIARDLNPTKDELVPGDERVDVSAESYGCRGCHAAVTFRDRGVEEFVGRKEDTAEHRN